VRAKDRPVQLELPLGLPGSQYRLLAEELRQAVGEWRRVAIRVTPTSATQMAKDIRRGRFADLIGMDAVVRRGYEVWARCPE
jgi:hypothetical protein